jgi:hypothetical protein
MASCASDRRSTQAELLAECEVPKFQVDLAGFEPTALRSASAVLSRTELQAQGPAGMAGRRVFNYARTGVNSSERPMRTSSKGKLQLPETKRPASGPSRWS